MYVCKHAYMLSHFSPVRLFAAHQALLSMGFSREGYWSGLPCPPPGDFPNRGIKAESLTPPALAGGGFFFVCLFFFLFVSLFYHYHHLGRPDILIRSNQSLIHGDSLRPHESQHARTPCSTPTPGVH